MDAPITLLYVITGTGTGGAEKALCEFVGRIDRSRFRVIVCSLKKPGAYASRLAERCDAFHHLNLDEAAGLRGVVNFIPAALRLSALMRRERPGIVHCFLFRASMMGRFAACLCPGAAVIAAVRVKEQERWKYLMERMTRRMVDFYTAVSEEVRRSMLCSARVDPSRIITVYNGIDCADCRIPPELSETPHDPVRVALIGRLHPQKGHGVLLEALRIIVARNRRVHLYFAGEGPDEDRLRLMARELGVEGSVTFSGVVHDILAFMADIDIVVLPSLWEGMPNVLLEAMAARRPIVASRLEGIEEMLSHETSALLCEPGDPQGLAGAIMRLVDDPALGRALARAARAEAETRFDIDQTAAATLELYGRLVPAAAPIRRDDT